MPVPEKVKRNQKLYEDYKKGMTTVQLVMKYQVSPARIFKLIERIKSQEGGGNNNGKTQND